MNSVSPEIEIILDYPGGPSVITRVLIGGRQESYRQRHDHGSTVMWSHEPRVVAVSVGWKKTKKQIGHLDFSPVKLTSYL